MSGFFRNGVAVPAAVGLAYAKMLGIEGNSSSDAVPAIFDVALAGMTSRYNLPSGATTLTLAILRAGILTATNPGSTSINLPTTTTLGWTRPSDGSQELFLRMQRIGTGPLFVNPVAGVTIVWNDLDPQFLSQYHPPVGLLYCGVDGVSGNETWAGV